MKPELLIPAGNLEKLRTAILYGADAVYMGIRELSLRAASAEFSFADLETGVREARAKGVKVYAAINIFAKNKDLELIEETVKILAEIKIDGVILSDPGVLSIVRKVAPALTIHLSTQANTTNEEAVHFWMKQGVKRFILARELNLTEVAEIAAAAPDAEIELFVHGAMCVAYSGRCFLSAQSTGRSSNDGDCAHPCRWEYMLVESTRPDQPLMLEEDKRHSYLLSSKDLCMIEYLPEIIKAGVTSLKIEGRMKSVYYIAVVTRTYRQALDEAMADAEGNLEYYKRRPAWLNELKKISNRNYTTGFYFADEKINEINAEVKYIQSHDLAGTVLEYDVSSKRILVGVRNQVTDEDRLELLLPDEIINLDAKTMTDPNGLPVRKTHNSYQVYFPVHQEIPAGAVIRKKIK